MNQEQWDKWKDHPQTVTFFKFLTDLRGVVARDVAEDVSKGSVVRQEYIEELTRKCGIYHELENLEFEAIESFYEEEAITKEDK